MTDVHSPEVRSYNMSRIRNKDTKPEIVYRKALFRSGFRYAKNDKRLPGKPDLVLRKYNAVIFVHGCFWHGHENCKYFKLPKSNTEFWENKIAQNIERDSKAVKALTEDGWRVRLVWECSLKTKEQIEHQVAGTQKWLKDDQATPCRAVLAHYQSE